MTLTAEGLWVLSGQLPFQCPVGEGKAHRAEPAEETAGPAAGQEPPAHCRSHPAPRLERGLALSPWTSTPRWTVAVLLSPSLCVSSGLGLGPACKASCLTLLYQDHLPGSSPSPHLNSHSSGGLVTACLSIWGEDVCIGAGRACLSTPQTPALIKPKFTERHLFPFCNYWFFLCT